MASSYTVECTKHRRGQRVDEEHAFNTKEEARDFAYVMLTAYGFRVWVDGVELNRGDFK